MSNLYKCANCNLKSSQSGCDNKKCVNYSVCSLCEESIIRDEHSDENCFYFAKELEVEINLLNDKIERLKKKVIKKSPGRCVSKLAKALDKMVKTHESMTKKKDDSVCPVCLECLETSQDQTMSLECCKNKIHITCLFYWFCGHCNCPLCGQSKVSFLKWEFDEKPILPNYLARKRERDEEESLELTRNFEAETIARFDLLESGVPEGIQDYVSKCDWCGEGRVGLLVLYECGSQVHRYHRRCQYEILNMRNVYWEDFFNKCLGCNSKMLTVGVRGSTRYRSPMEPKLDQTCESCDESPLEGQDPKTYPCENGIHWYHERCVIVFQEAGLMDVDLKEAITNCYKCDEGRMGDIDNRRLPFWY